MNIEEIYKILTKELKDGVVYKNEPMSKHTSFKIGGNADIYIKVKNIQDIKYILNFANNKNIPITVIGNGSNLLVKDNGIRGITMQMDLQEVDIKGTTVIAGAGVKLGILGLNILKKELTGFEFAAGIPGTIGGAIRMNAGAYGGEFSNIVEKVTCITRKGIIKELSKEELQFSYRHSKFMENDDIILYASLELRKSNIKEIKSKMDELMISRRTKQPLDIPSARKYI